MCYICYKTNGQNFIEIANNFLQAKFWIFTDKVNARKRKASVPDDAQTDTNQKDTGMNRRHKYDFDGQKTIDDGQTQTNEVSTTH